MEIDLLDIFRKIVAIRKKIYKAATICLLYTSFDENLNVANDYFLGNPEEIRKLMEAVANQGKKK